MTNAELIKVLRYCGKSLGCDEGCPLLGKPSGACFKMMLDAAAALEAAEKRIAELMPKDGEWIWEDSVCSPRICSVCKQKFYIGRGWNYCPNCGAKMRTVTECHTLEEGER